MNIVALVIAAALLTVERASYLLIARAPVAFLALCGRLGLGSGRGPIAVVERLFWAFKALQVAVFAVWCYVHGGGSLVPAARDPIVVGLGAVFVGVGQILVLATFHRLGRVGVFFGDRLGYEVRQSRAFPFSVLAHPQYVGTTLTIWGFFLVMRFPHGDWYALPVLESVYYAAGAWLEAPRAVAQGLRKRIAPI